MKEAMAFARAHCVRSPGDEDDGDDEEELEVIDEDIVEEVLEEETLEEGGESVPRGMGGCGDLEGEEDVYEDDFEDDERPQDSNEGSAEDARMADTHMSTRESEDSPKQFISGTETFDDYILPTGLPERKEAVGAMLRRVAFIDEVRLEPGPAQAVSLPRGMLPACDNKKKSDQQFSLRLLPTSCKESVRKLVRGTAPGKLLLERDVRQGDTGGLENLAVLHENDALVTYVHRKNSNLYATTSTPRMNLAGRPRKLVWLSTTASTALVVHVSTEMRSEARYALDILRTDEVVTSHSGGNVLNRGYRRREGAESLPTVPGLTPELLLLYSQNSEGGSVDDVCFAVSDGEAGAVAAAFRDESGQHQCFLLDRQSGGAWRRLSEFLMPVPDAAAIIADAVKMAFAVDAEEGELFVSACVAQTLSAGTEINTVGVLVGSGSISTCASKAERCIRSRSLPVCASLTVAPVTVGLTLLAWSEDGGVLALVFGPTADIDMFSIHMYSRHLEPIATISWETVVAGSGHPLLSERSDTYCCGCQWTGGRFSDAFNDATFGTIERGRKYHLSSNRVLVLVDSNLLTAFVSDSGNILRVLAGNAGVGSSEIDERQYLTCFSWREALQAGGGRDARRSLRGYHNALDTPKRVAVAAYKMAAAPGLHSSPTRVILLCNKVLFWLDCRVAASIHDSSWTEDDDMIKDESLSVGSHNDSEVNGSRWAAAIASFCHFVRKDFPRRVSGMPCLRLYLSDIASSLVSCLIADGAYGSAAFVHSVACRALDAHAHRADGSLPPADTKVWEASLRSHCSRSGALPFAIQCLERHGGAGSTEDDDARIEELVRLFMATSLGGSEQSLIDLSSRIAMRTQSSSAADKAMMLGRVDECASAICDSCPGNALPLICLRILQYDMATALILLQDHLRILCGTDAGRDSGSTVGGPHAPSDTPRGAIELLERFVGNIGRLRIESIDSRKDAGSLGEMPRTVYFAPPSDYMIAADEDPSRTAPGDFVLSSTVPLLAWRVLKSFEAASCDARVGPMVDLCSAAGMVRIGACDDNVDAAIASVSQACVSRGDLDGALVLAMGQLIATSATDTRPAGGAVLKFVSDALRKRVDDLMKAPAFDAHGRVTFDEFSRVYLLLRIFMAFGCSRDAYTLSRTIITTLQAAIRNIIIARVKCTRASSLGAAADEVLGSLTSALEGHLSTLMMLMVRSFDDADAGGAHAEARQDELRACQDASDELCDLGWMWVCHDQVMRCLSPTRTPQTDDPDSADVESSMDAIWALELLSVNGDGGMDDIKDTQRLSLVCWQSCSRWNAGVISLVDEKGADQMLPVIQSGWKELRAACVGTASADTSIADRAKREVDGHYEEFARTFDMIIGDSPPQSINAGGMAESVNAHPFLSVVLSAKHRGKGRTLFTDAMRSATRLQRADSVDPPRERDRLEGVNVGDDLYCPSVIRAWACLIFARAALLARESASRGVRAADAFCALAIEIHSFSLLMQSASYGRSANLPAFTSHVNGVGLADLLAKVVEGFKRRLGCDNLADLAISEDDLMDCVTNEVIPVVSAAMCAQKLFALILVCVASERTMQTSIREPFLTCDELRRLYLNESCLDAASETREMTRDDGRPAAHGTSGRGAEDDSGPSCGGSDVPRAASIERSDRSSDAQVSDLIYGGGGGPDAQGSRTNAESVPIADQDEDARAPELSVDTPEIELRNECVDEANEAADDGHDDSFDSDMTIGEVDVHGLLDEDVICRIAPPEPTSLEEMEVSSSPSLEDSIESPLVDTTVYEDISKSQTLSGLPLLLQGRGGERMRASSDATDAMDDTASLSASDVEEEQKVVSASDTDVHDAINRDTDTEMTSSHIVMEQTGDNTEKLTEVIESLRRELANVSDNLSKRLQETEATAAKVATAAALHAIEENRDNMPGPVGECRGDVRAHQGVLSNVDEASNRQRKETSDRLRNMMARLRSNGARNRALAAKRRDAAVGKENAHISNVVVVDSSKIKELILRADEGPSQHPSIVPLSSSVGHTQRAEHKQMTVVDGDSADEQRRESCERAVVPPTEAPAPQGASSGEDVEEGRGEHTPGTSSVDTQRTISDNGSYCDAPTEGVAEDDSSRAKPEATAESQPLDPEPFHILRDGEDVFSVLEALTDVDANIHQKNSLLDAALHVAGMVDREQDQPDRETLGADGMFFIQLRIPYDVSRVLQLLCSGISSHTLRYLCALTDLHFGRECSASQLKALIRDVSSATRAARAPRHAAVWETVQTLLVAVRGHHTGALALLCGTFIASSSLSSSDCGASDRSMLDTEMVNSRSARLVRFVRRLLPGAHLRHVRYLMAVFYEGGLCCDDADEMRDFNAETVLDNIVFVMSVYTGEVTAGKGAEPSSWMVEVAGALAERRAMNEYMHRSATRIQASYRGVLARRKLRQVRQMRADEEAEKRTTAALRIQRAFRRRRGTALPDAADDESRGTDADGGEGEQHLCTDPEGSEDASGADASIIVPPQMATPVIASDDRPSAARTQGLGGGNGGNDCPIEIKVCVVPFDASDFLPDSMVTEDGNQGVRYATSARGANIVIPVGSPSAKAASVACASAAGETTDANTQTDDDVLRTSDVSENTSMSVVAVDDSCRQNEAALKIQRAFRRQAESKPATKQRKNSESAGLHEENGAPSHVPSSLVDGIIATVEEVAHDSRILSVDEMSRECTFLHVSDITYEECLRDIGAANPIAINTRVSQAYPVSGAMSGGDGEDSHVDDVHISSEGAVEEDQDRTDDCVARRRGPDESTTASDGRQHFGLAHEDGYDFVNRIHGRAPGGAPDAATRNAMRNGQLARLVEEAHHGVGFPDDAELRKLRQFKMSHLRKDYACARAAHRRAVDGVIGEVRAALNDVNASATVLEEEVMGMRRVMRGYAPSLNRIIVEGLSTVS